MPRKIASGFSSLRFGKIGKKAKKSGGPQAASACRKILFAPLNKFESFFKALKFTDLNGVGNPSYRFEKFIPLSAAKVFQALSRAAAFFYFARS